LKSNESGLRPATSSSATARASSSFPPKWRLRRSKPRSKRRPPRAGSQPPSATAWARGKHSKLLGCSKRPNLPKKPQFMPYNSHVLRQTDHLEIRLGLRTRLPFWLHLSARPLRIFFVHCLHRLCDIRVLLHDVSRHGLDHAIPRFGCEFLIARPAEQRQRIGKTFSKTTIPANVFSSRHANFAARGSENEVLEGR